MLECEPQSISFGSHSSVPLVPQWRLVQEVRIPQGPSRHRGLDSGATGWSLLADSLEGVRSLGAALVD